MGGGKAAGTFRWRCHRRGKALSYRYAEYRLFRAKGFSAMRRHSKDGYGSQFPIGIEIYGDGTRRGRTCDVEPERVLVTRIKSQGPAIIPGVIRHGKWVT